MFVSLGRTQTWRLHTKFYKFGWHTSAKNARMKNSRDVILAGVVYISIIYRISDSWLFSLNGYVPVKSKLQHPPSHIIPPAFDASSCPGGRAFDHHSQEVGNLIANLDVMLRVELIPRGLINHGGDDRIHQTLMNSKERLRIRDWLVENQRPTQALFCIWRCLRPIYIYL